MKFIKARFMEDGMTISVSSNEEHEFDIDVVLENVRNQYGRNECYLFLPSDKPNCGSPIKPDISREEYLENPAKYGVCIYKNYDNKVVFE